jgi:glutathione S-transferase
MGRTWDFTTSYTASVLRGGLGRFLVPLGPRPEKHLELYEFEACPFCRRVREALTILDLDAIIYPCPKGGTRFRTHVKDRGGKMQFPYFVDPNAGVEMYESADIVKHLFARYGAGPVHLGLRGPLAIATGSLASAVRFGRGGRARPSRAPERPLELYSFEVSPYCRMVRETLCELEIPYVLHNVGKKGAGRPAFVARSGKQMVPWISDPNTGTEMFESAEINAYLEKTYAITDR